MSEITDRIAALEAELTALKAHVAEAEAAEVERTSRRAVFKKLAVGAAGVAAGASVLRAQPAAAANGAAIVTGGSVDGTSATRADYLGPGSTTGFLFQSGNGFGPAGPTYPAALAGWSGPTGTLVHGVYGFSAVGGGAGVVGNGGGTDGVGGYFTGTRAALQLGNKGPVDTIDFTTVQKGDVLMSDDGDLWLGVGAGEVRKLGGATTAGVLHLLPAPPRAYDSRTGTGAGTGYLSASSGARVVNLATGRIGTGTVDAVPADATGALLSVTLDATLGSGFLAVYQDGIAWPGNSNLNWYTDGQILAVTTVSAVKDAKINLKVGGGGSTQVVIDVIGYYF